MILKEYQALTPEEAADQDARDLIEFNVGMTPYQKLQPRMSSGVGYFARLIEIAKVSWRFNHLKRKAEISRAERIKQMEAGQ